MRASSGLHAKYMHVATQTTGGRSEINVMIDALASERVVRLDVGNPSHHQTKYPSVQLVLDTTSNPTKTLKPPSNVQQNNQNQINKSKTNMGTDQIDPALGLNADTAINRSIGEQGSGVQ